MDVVTKVTQSAEIEATKKRLFTEAVEKLGLPENEAGLIIKMAGAFTNAMTAVTVEGLIAKRQGLLIADLVDSSFGDLLASREKVWAPLAGGDDKAKKVQQGLDENMAKFKTTVEEAKIMTMFVSAAGVTLALLTAFGEVSRDVSRAIMRRFQNNVETMMGVEPTAFDALADVEVQGHA